MFTDQLRRYTEDIVPEGFTLTELDAQILAKNLVTVLAALAGLSRGIAANLAAYVAEGTAKDPDDLAVTRPLELGFLGGGAKALLATIRGDDDRAG